MIKNHGISQNDINSTFKMVRSFFDKDLKYKQKFGINYPNHEDIKYGISSIAGYHGIGTEIESGKHYDWKESYDFYLSDIYPLIDINKFPLNLDSLNNYLISMRSTLSTIAQIISMSLHRQRFYISNMIDSSLNSVFRFIHYPPTPKHNDTFKSPALGAHTDYVVITIGFQDSSQGFEAWDKLNKQWVEVPYIPGAMVLNLGDVMQRWSNDKYTATFHRMKSVDSDRYSMYIFGAPDMDTIIDPKDFSYQNETRRHEPTTAHDIISHRIQALYTGKERNDQKLGDLEALKS